MTPGKRDLSRSHVLRQVSKSIVEQRYDGEVGPLTSCSSGAITLLKYFFIGIGGFAGAIARYVLGSYVGSRYGVRFPYGTLIVNMSGCFAIGLIMVFLGRATVSPQWRYLIPIGFIGAYTTFSTFEYETLRAVQDGQLVTGLLNVAVSVVVGFFAVWLGAVSARLFV